jgi:uncharacterized protein DUF6782
MSHRRVLATIGALCIILASAPTAAASTPTRQPPKPHKASKPPSRWDARILKYVRFVEKERGLHFKHPIPVDFLDDKAFNKKVSTSNADLTKQDRRDLKVQAGDFYALGLVGPHLDLLKADNALNTGGVVGFYDQDTKRMVIRGKDLTSTDVRVTVVHELTHALQDQYFNLTKLEDHTKSSGQDLALTALIEGDASYVEESYVASLPKAEQDKYYSDPGAALVDPGGPPPSSADVPPALEVFFGVPYDIGYWFVDFLHGAHNDIAKVNAAFRHPPQSDEQVIDPIAFIKHDRPHPPKLPKLAKGEKRRGAPDELGAVGLYFTLAARLSPRDALVAATGWNGDRILRYSADGNDCVRVAIANDSPADAKELATAFGKWITAGSSDTVDRSGTVVTLDACGAPSAKVPTADTMDQAELDLSVRYLDYGIATYSFNLKSKSARCVGDKMATDTAIVNLLGSKSFSDFTKADNNLFVSHLTTYFSDCGEQFPGASAN